MEDEILKLDNQLCFALYACAKEVTRIYKPFLDKLGITYTQYITLLVLWEQDCITVKELGKKLYLDSGTLTPLLKKLENLGVLERVRDTKDERNVFVKLTDKGINMKNEVVEIPKEVFCSTGLSPEDALELKERLRFLLVSLDR
ncbi:MAG: MarR family winged helix-turn-helix transcriptional regulator [Clostridiaceae bacterium]